MEKYKNIIASGLLGFGLIGLSCSQNYLEKSKDEIRQNLEKITIAPDFEYTTLEGKTISLKDSENKLLILEWWSIDCEFCIEQIPENNRIYKRFGNRDDFLFLAVNGNYASDVEDREEAKKAMIKHLKGYKEKKGILYPMASDPLWESGIKDKFNISGRPVTVLIKNGKIIEKFKGKPEDGVLEKTIEDLLD